MPNLELSWHAAAIIAGCLALAVPSLRRSPNRFLAGSVPYAQESAVILGLFALWQYAGSFGVMGPDGALGRAQWIWDAERAAHLPSETTVQAFFLPHPLVVEFFNYYYASLHFPVLVGTMIWLFVRHRDKYPAARTTLVAVTAACLLIQLIPVAPPRMLPSTGMVDTAIEYGQSVYSMTAGFNPDQLSAMPSVHVGWAVLVAILIIRTARTRWRWLWLLYPAATTLIVAATANHFWADGIVAAALLLAVLAVQHLVTKLRREIPRYEAIAEKVDVASSRYH
ncbi:MAG TPA: phosphatase PAP2 family protein [Streptosporangiaceae bacterium]|jgi:PAP2 superfamily|nr:phosphatase PAP2 family protein [Streptosporangiaceae bacterium]